MWINKFSFYSRQLLVSHCIHMTLQRDTKTFNWSSTKHWVGEAFIIWSFIFKSLLNYLLNVTTWNLTVFILCTSFPPFYSFSDLLHGIKIRRLLCVLQCFHITNVFRLSCFLQFQTAVLVREENIIFISCTISRAWLLSDAPKGIDLVKICFMTSIMLF